MSDLSDTSAAPAAPSSDPTSGIRTAPGAPVATPATTVGTSAPCAAGSLTPTPAEPPAEAAATAQAPAKEMPKRENLILNILFNIAVPSAVLAWLSEPRWWHWFASLVGNTAAPGSDADKVFASACGLVLALLFPIIYGVYDLIARRKTNVISLLGIGSVLITGGMGLMKADGFWFAVKDAGIPLLIGGMVLATQRTKRPLVREFLYNDQVLNTPRIDAALAASGATADFERLLARSSYLLAFGFVISAILNFGLARYLLRSPAGTPEFNSELARMHMLSWPVIILPTMAITVYALWRLLDGVEKLSGLSFDDLMHEVPAKSPAKASDEKSPKSGK